ncbi:MAG: hypothetical protein OXI81_19050 [Paracoccaceae bacterium]|nr:hypothetical protein [Paracoccaceae bacterium]MDE2913157.1 hypothetical protein [Paracoccaceae bacterium]
MDAFDLDEVVIDYDKAKAYALNDFRSPETNAKFDDMYAIWLALHELPTLLNPNCVEGSSIQGLSTLPIWNRNTLSRLPIETDIVRTPFAFARQENMGPVRGASVPERILPFRVGRTANPDPGVRVSQCVNRVLACNDVC